MKKIWLSALSSFSVEAILGYDWFWITEEYIVPTPNLFRAHGQMWLTTTEKGFCTDAGYKGSGRRVLVEKKE